MTPIDRLLQGWRFEKARRFLPRGARVLDVGCGDGALFTQLSSRIASGVGVDEHPAAPDLGPAFSWVRGHFPGDVDVPPRSFDAVCAFAVLEHIPPQTQPAFARACFDALAPGGVLLLTTPAPLVDPILDALRFLRLIDGMELEQHYGFEPALTPGIFLPAGFKLRHQARFQLGLNHLFVFMRA